MWRPNGCTSIATRSRPGWGCRSIRVHVVLAGVGGAFGAREDLSMQLHACMLALRCGRPVKMAYLREESFAGGHVHRHPAWMEYEHHADRQGKLVAVRARLWLDGGAYASTSPAVIANATTLAVGPYAVDNADLLGIVAYTNNTPSGAMRGFGSVQVAVAYEAQMDRLAAAVGRDPLEVRRGNALAAGRHAADRPGRAWGRGDGGAARCPGGAAASWPGRRSP